MLAAVGLTHEGHFLWIFCGAHFHWLNQRLVKAQRLIIPTPLRRSDQNTALVVSHPIAFVMPRTSLLLPPKQIQASGRCKKQTC